MQNTVRLLTAIGTLAAFLYSGWQHARAIPARRPASHITIDSTFLDMPFPMGASLNTRLLKNNGQYRQLAASQFRSITAENVMKFAALQPQEGQFNFTEADDLIAFARQNRQRVHGHTLLWHASVPQWVHRYAGDSAALEGIMRTHIQTVVAHFKGQVTSWDVVNEAFEDNGVLRNSIWRQTLGPGYIARAFQYAHAADPGARLFYNDYGHEYSPLKRSAINKLLLSLVEKGIPVHGTGLQMHTHYTQHNTNLAAAIETAASTGLLVHISELDISMNPGNSPTLSVTPAQTAAQAAKYAFVMRTYLKLPEAQRFGITLWNLTDGDSWLRPTYNRPDWPLPFDEHYRPKPAYDSILAAARH